MSQIRVYSGLAKAQAVLGIMQTMLDEDAPADQDISVATFRNGRSFGLQLIAEAQVRKCNLFGDTGSDSIIAVIGSSLDFNLADGSAKDSAERYTFAHDEYYAAASFVMKWLTTGEIDNDEETS
jgi:hypothetical protein